MVLTSLTSLDHQLIDRLKLSVVPPSYSLWLNVGHIDRSSVLVVVECLANKDANSLQTSRLNCI